MRLFTNGQLKKTLIYILSTLIYILCNRLLNANDTHAKKIFISMYNAKKKFTLFLTSNVIIQ